MLRKKNMSVQIKREISLMRLIHNENVIQIKDVFATEHKIFMVLELVEGGELFDKIVDKVYLLFCQRILCGCCSINTNTIFRREGLRQRKPDSTCGS